MQRGRAGTNNAAQGGNGAGTVAGTNEDIALNKRLIDPLETFQRGG